ncbi:hypothetical protein [Marinibactrum halimedae]|uniref:Uncharacterized protein n=1 Tax=Marinibactrum halimedae TaxID=1444977 RepID=A0AA37WP48_9GAMM|nr:hypothetical protein [Marinibactrum halimedae]MCD9459030.1 hypothetical protein [Marinibactrum halimedae]GLS26841.1 hypothetical protein GCM10007877_25600 [Marinibactrum halimedae]
MEIRYELNLLLSAIGEKYSIRDLVLNEKGNVFLSVDGKVDFGFSTFDEYGYVRMYGQISDLGVNIKEDKMTVICSLLSENITGFHAPHLKWSYVSDEDIVYLVRDLGEAELNIDTFESLINDFLLDCESAKSRLNTLISDSNAKQGEIRETFMDSSILWV